MAEAFDVQDRGSFYDAVGALRDVVQNHMLQVLANVMMDAPTGEEHEAQRDQKAALLKAVRPLDAASLVRGQYKGYRSVKGVRPDSTTETYVALKLFVDSWRWAGVPDLYPRRQMPAVDRRRGHDRFQAAAPFDIWRADRPISGLPARAAEPRRWRCLGFADEAPRRTHGWRQCELTLMQRAGSDMPPYQRLLGDAMRGNNELFGREDTVDAQWRIVEPILKSPAGPGIPARKLGPRRGERAYRRRRPVAESPRPQTKA